MSRIQCEKKKEKKYKNFNLETQDQFRDRFFTCISLQIKELIYDSHVQTSLSNSARGIRVWTIRFSTSVFVLLSLAPSGIDFLPHRETVRFQHAFIAPFSPACI